MSGVSTVLLALQCTGLSALSLWNWLFRLFLSFIISVGLGHLMWACNTMLGIGVRTLVAKKSGTSFLCFPGIWQPIEMNWLPIVNRYTLYTPKMRAGLGVANAVKYFQAAQLSQLIRFHTQAQCPIWMQLESCILPSRPVRHLLWKQAYNIMSHPLSFWLDLWDRVTNKCSACVLLYRSYA